MNKVIPIQDEELSVYDLVRIDNTIKLSSSKKETGKLNEEIMCKICLEGYLCRYKGILLMGSPFQKIS